MEEKSFEAFAKIVIKRDIEEEYQKAVSFDKLDRFEVRWECGNNANAFNAYIKKLYKKYEYHNKKLKKQLSMNLQEDKLDCHKVAAVLLYTILELKPIKFSFLSVNKIEEIPDNIKLINYRIAFKVACGVIFTDLLKELDEEIKAGVENSSEAKEKLTKNGKLFLPKVRKGLARYIDNYAKILYYNDKQKRGITDYLTVADTMFLIETLNKAYIKSDITSAMHKY